MGSSYLQWRSSATSRRTPQTADEPNSLGPQQTQLMHHSPTPKPIFQFIAFGLIIFLTFLQFLLPATHFRHPSDPFRNWLPLHSNTSKLRASSNGNSSGREDENGMLHIVSWMDCLDLRLLAVLANSTLSTSSSRLRFRAKRTSRNLARIRMELPVINAAVYCCVVTTAADNAEVELPVLL
ncbi:hypothetical protein Q3G72_033147 [Acer saccharum]|nr:hypothetical protein Q3G72_033147 [Acer saccharum]